MRLQLRFLLAAMAMIISLAAGQSAQAVDLYVIAWDNPSQLNKFGTINSDTGVYTNISDITGVPSFTMFKGLAWNPSISAFNATSTTGDLFSISLSGSGTAIAPALGNGLTLSYNTANSTMYGLAKGALKTIDTTTGATVSIGNPNLEALYDSANLNGTLYATADTGPLFSPDYRFGAINLSNGSYTTITNTNDFEYYDMLLASNGTSLFGLNNNNSKIYSINPATGSYTLLSTITGVNDGNNTFIKAVAATVPVPEPSTYALGAIAMGVMAAVARRRKARRA